MITDFEKDFAKNLRRIRKEKGLTQEQLAARLQLKNCDLSRSIIANIESGQRHIYPQEIKLMKEILDTTYEELFQIDKK